MATWPPGRLRGATRRAGERGAGAGLTVAEVAPHTTWKSSEPKTELDDLMGLLQGRGQGALPGVSRWRPSHLFGRKRQLFLHCELLDDAPVPKARDRHEGVELCFER